MIQQKKVIFAKIRNKEMQSWSRWKELRKFYTFENDYQGYTKLSPVSVLYKKK